MFLPKNTTVLIFGAGPAGLTAALSLIHHRCHDFVIVDAVGEGLTIEGDHHTLCNHRGKLPFAFVRRLIDVIGVDGARAIVRSQYLPPT
jgi:2-polyprenyl-6-methoxyphenol hydroxylase-like FAD-dependent oxidoreductase